MNQSETNNRLLMGIIGGAVLILLVMLASIFMVTRRPVVVVVPAEAGSAGAAAALAPAAASSGPAVAEVPPPQINVSKVESAPAIDDPLDPFWEKIASVDVPLLPQQVAQPALASGTVPSLSVQAVKDEQRYVWRLSWEQAEPAAESDVGKFSDAVAMQFPLSEGAPYTMGGPKMPVRMLHWKATWQKDVDEGFQDWAKTHPNSDADLYWFAEGEAPYTMDKSFNDPMSKQWLIAASAGNPMANFARESPVEELTAHGFGSSTHIDKTSSRGRGVWKDGKWYVVMDRPIDTSDPLIQRFNENPTQQLVAFAVWDGQADNRGGPQEHNQLVTDENYAMNVDSVSLAAQADLVMLTVEMLRPPSDSFWGMTDFSETGDVHGTLHSEALPLDELIDTGLGSLGDRVLDCESELTPRKALADVQQCAQRLNGELRFDEHARMFDGSTACPLNQASYVRRDKGKILGDVSGFYHAFGWQGGTGTGERPDHLLCQLEFVGMLLALESQAPDQEAGDVVRKALSEFAREHMHDWLPAVCWQISDESRVDYFGAVSQWLLVLWQTLTDLHQWPMDELPDKRLKPITDPDDPYECGAPDLHQIQSR